MWVNIMGLLAGFCGAILLYSSIEPSESHLEKIRSYRGGRILHLALLELGKPQPYRRGRILHIALLKQELAQRGIIWLVSSYFIQMLVALFLPGK
jgi:hypothetical protein